MSARVRVGDTYTSTFSVNNGLRQGCSSAHVLFNLYFLLVMEKWQEHMAQEGDSGLIVYNNINGNLFNRPRSKHSTNSVLDLEFADDAVLFSLTWQKAQSALQSFVAVAASFGLTVSLIKTKYMSCGHGLSENDQRPLVVGSNSVDHVPSFVYLGSLLTPDGRTSQEIDRRIANASHAFGALRHVLCDAGLTLKTKRLVYSACVISVLLYGAECWPILRRDEIRLDSFHHRCLRAMLRALGPTAGAFYQFGHAQAMGRCWAAI